MRFFRPHSIRFEISVLLTLMMGIVLSIFSAVLYFILTNTLYTELDNHLKHKSQQLTQTVRAYLDVKGVEPDSVKYALEKSLTDGKDAKAKWWNGGFERRWIEQVKELNLEDVYVNFLSENESSLFRSENMTDEIVGSFLKLEDLLIDSDEDFRNIDFPDKKIRVLTVPFVYEDSPIFYLQIGTSLQPIVIVLQNWLHSMFYGIPVIMFLTAFFGWKLAGRILRPVEKITTTAHNITYDDLTTRIETKDYHTEMRHLVEAFNDMISRLQKSFTHIEDFSGNVAHELKTPLTIIRGETELALMEDRQPHEYQRVMNVTQEESEKMLKIVEDLLFLTRLDYQPEVLDFQSIEFNSFIKEIYEQSQILATGKKVKVILNGADQPVFVAGDAVHLRRLFFNLIDNALKFTPPGGKVELNVLPGKDNVIIKVSDTGVGITEEDLDKIFERFYRINYQKVGSGLGLNIAQTITHIHNGSIEVARNPRCGMTFTISLPLDISELKENISSTHSSQDV